MANPGIADAPRARWRQHLHRVVFESDTTAGKAFDLVLMVLIVGSVAVVVLDSVASVRAEYGATFAWLEWMFTAVFTVEYALRLLSARSALGYARSFYGVVDLLAILPTWLALLVPGLHALVDVRALRLLRIFRVLKLASYTAEFHGLAQAVRGARRRILVFLFFVAMVVLLMGTLLYVLEGPEHGFTSIPVGVYWAITTMTTVGFGDITPRTDLGRFVASLMMLLGWGTLAVPTGLVTTEYTMRRLRGGGTARCPRCQSTDLPADAAFCHRCGAPVGPAPGAG